MQKIDIKFKPSKLFILFFLLTIVASFAIVLTLPPFPLKKTLLFTIIFSYGGYLFWNSVLLQGGYAILRLSYGPDGWYLQDRIKTQQAELCGESTITRFLSILRFTVPGRRRKRTCLVFKDAIGQEYYRQLIVILRTAEIH